nr:MAG TPA: hypothetical protein [Caudoviricetes sp.]
MAFKLLDYPFAQGYKRAIAVVGVNRLKKISEYGGNKNVRISETAFW